MSSDAAVQPSAPKKMERLVSLDVFRGLTIAGMILVNNPGSWKAGHIYPPLEHAPWDGWTPTDWVFPFFLFMVGVAMTFSFDRRLASGANRALLMAHVFCRSAVLILLGLVLTGFPNFRLITPYILAIIGLEILLEKPSRKVGEPLGPARWVAWISLVAAVIWFIVDFRYFNGPTSRGSWKDFFPLANDPNGSVIRVPGVLQRIGVCYLFTALILLFTRDARGRLAWVFVLLAAYWLVMVFVHPPAGYQFGGGVVPLDKITIGATPNAPFPGLLNDWLDVKLLGAHLYKERPDPEGILSTIPAIATTLLGVLAGMLLKSDRSKYEKCTEMLVWGVACLALGSILDIFFPINKKIWSPSYVVFMNGWALLILGLCYYVVDIHGWKSWATPFLVLGTNAITAFFASSLMARIVTLFKVHDGNELITLKEFLFRGLLAQFDSPRNASLAYALCYVVLWILLLAPLYRRKIFIRV